VPEGTASHTTGQSSWGEPSKYHAPCWQLSPGLAILTSFTRSDLGYSIKPEEIFDKLKEVWDIPLRRKSKVLALTVPEVGLEAGRERRDSRRTKLNDLIKAYKREGL